jgi:hypothetical protein
MIPLPGAIEAYKALCEKYDCYILSTSPWNNPTAASDKFDWVKKIPRRCGIQKTYTNTSQKPEPRRLSY